MNGTIYVTSTMNLMSVGNNCKVKTNVKKNERNIMFNYSLLVDVHIWQWQESGRGGGDSTSHKASYRKISQSLEGARSVVRVFHLLWNLAGAKFHSDTNILKAIHTFQARSRTFETLWDLALIRLVSFRYRLVTVRHLALPDSPRDWFKERPVKIEYYGIFSDFGRIQRNAHEMITSCVSAILVFCDNN